MELESKIDGVLSHAEACLAHRDDIDSINSGHLLSEYAELLRMTGWTETRDAFPKLNEEVLVVDVMDEKVGGVFPKETAFMRTHTPGTCDFYWELPLRECSNLEYMHHFTHWLRLPLDPSV